MEREGQERMVVVKGEWEREEEKNGKASRRKLENFDN
jgi:hypothetical protein